MSPRYMRIAKSERYYNTNIETLIERLRKARALGCNLSYLGIDSQTCKKLSSNRIGSLIK